MVVAVGPVVVEDGRRDAAVVSTSVLPVGVYAVSHLYYFASADDRLHRNDRAVGYQVIAQFVFESIYEVDIIELAVPFEVLRDVLLKILLHEAIICLLMWITHTCHQHIHISP